MVFATVPTIQTAQYNQTNPDRAGIVNKITVTRLIISHLVKLYRDTRLPHIVCTWTAKTHAIPSLYRDYFMAKVEVQWPVLRRVTPTNFIAGPLGGIARPLGNKK